MKLNGVKATKTLVAGKKWAVKKTVYQIGKPFCYYFAIAPGWLVKKITFKKLIDICNKV